LYSAYSAYSGNDLERFTGAAYEPDKKILWMYSSDGFRAFTESGKLADVSFDQSRTMREQRVDGGGLAVIYMDGYTV
jgi:hypothetical protein